MTKAKRMKRRGCPEMIDVMCAAHAADIQEIHKAINCSDECPSREEIVSWTTNRYCNSFVAELPGTGVIGYIVWTFAKPRLIVSHLAVHPLHWRRGIGRRLLTKAILNTRTDHTTYAEVPEWNERAIKFLSACGMRARLEGDNYAFEITQSSYQGFLVLRSVMECDGLAIY